MSQKQTKEKTLPDSEEIPKLNLKHRAKSPKSYL